MRSITLRLIACCSLFFVCSQSYGIVSICLPSGPDGFYHAGIPDPWEAQNPTRITQHTSVNGPAPDMYDHVVAAQVWHIYYNLSPALYSWFGLTLLEIAIGYWDPWGNPVNIS